MVEASAVSYDEKDRSMIVSCTISPGMSGGPVVDRDGSLVGLVMEQTDGAGEDAATNVSRHVVAMEYLRQMLEVV